MAWSSRFFRPFTHLRLTGTIALAGLVVLPAVGSVLALLLDMHAMTRLTTAAERHNVALAQVLGSGLNERLLPLVATDGQAAPAQIEAAHAEIVSRLRGTDVVKVKVYDRTGRTVFSTERAQIGEDKSGNAGFLSAIRGDVASELTWRGQFSAFEGVIENRDLLSSYIGISLAGGGPADAVFEIYADVSGLMATLRQERWIVAGLVGLSFLAVGIILVAVVARAERLVGDEHARSLRLTAEAASAEAASATKSQFLATLSHEIRTPLNAVIGFTQALHLGYAGPLGHRQQQYVGDVLRSATHLAAIVDDLLDMARIESGQISLLEGEHEIAEVVSAAVAIVGHKARDRGIELTVGLPPGLPRVRGDAVRLRQVLINLLSNALRFAPAGSHIRVVGALAAGGLELKVEDNGPGIAPEDLPRVMEPFVQLQPGDGKRPLEGLGLGLPIARRLAELHGGSLRLDSVLGAGTRAIVTLPIYRLSPG
ncbi:MAG: hypothetical protein OHK0024_15060 [Thalassobaculales bacterium]